MRKTSVRLRACRRAVQAAKTYDRPAATSNSFPDVPQRKLRHPSRQPAPSKSCVHRQSQPSGLAMGCGCATARMKRFQNRRRRALRVAPAHPLCCRGADTQFRQHPTALATRARAGQRHRTRRQGPSEAHRRERQFARYRTRLEEDCVGVGGNRVAKPEG